MPVRVNAHPPAHVHATAPCFEGSVDNIGHGDRQDLLRSRCSWETALDGHSIVHNIHTPYFPVHFLSTASYQEETTSVNEMLQKELEPNTGEIHKPSQEEVCDIIIICDENYKQPENHQDEVL